MADYALILACMAVILAVIGILLASEMLIFSAIVCAVVALTLVGLMGYGRAHNLTEVTESCSMLNKPA